jgi:hypothetical protein
MARRRTRQRGGDCGSNHQLGGGRRRKSRRRRGRKGGGKGLNEKCTWLPMGSQCDNGLTCKNNTCQTKTVSSGPSAHTMGTMGNISSMMPKLWGGKRRKSRRRRKRSRGRKSRRKRRTKRRRRRR